MRRFFIVLVLLTLLWSTAPAAVPDHDNVTVITNGWVDVNIILETIAGNAGMGLEIAPDVSEKVNAHLVDVPLVKALSSLLEPVGIGYEIVDGVLVVFKRGLVTRWFSFNYPVTERQGRGELRVSGRGSTQSGGGGGSGQDGENESHVSSSSVMKVWPQITGALKVLVFEDSQDEAGSESSGSDAVSIADAEGRILVVNPMAGLVQVTAEWPRIRHVESFLSRTEEALLRQVAIEVKIFEVTLWDSRRTGVDWTTFSGRDVDATLVSTEALDPVFSFIVNNNDVTGLVEAISDQGDVKVLSTPRITTLNNQKAVVRVVTEEVYFIAQVQPAVVTNGTSTTPVVEYEPAMIPVGVVLDVTPQIGQNGMITLNVHPTISNVVRVEISPNEDTAPVISVRELDTVGKVGDGKTLVIAGLMYDSITDNSTGVPFLKNIPLLGYLFKRSYQEVKKTELIMLLTPVVLDEGRVQAMSDEAEQLIKDKM